MHSETRWKCTISPQQEFYTCPVLYTIQQKQSNKLLSNKRLLRDSKTVYSFFGIQPVVFIHSATSGALSLVKWYSDFGEGYLQKGGIVQHTMTSRSSTNLEVIIKNGRIVHVCVCVHVCVYLATRNGRARACLLYRAIIATTWHCSRAWAACYPLYSVRNFSIISTCGIDKGPFISSLGRGGRGGSFIEPQIYL